MDTPPNERATLEAALLSAPFDARLRMRYAQALLDEAAFESARHQFELCAQADGSAAPLLGQARALLALGDVNSARDAYAKARGREGFETLAALEAPTPERPARPRLGLVEASGEIREVSVEPAEVEHETPARFADVAGLDDLKKSLRLQIIEPFRNPGLFARFRKSAGGGVMLYGPPGCGKTLIARALAGEVGGSFISVGVSEVVSMWFGESEEQLADVFARARAQRPCVLFFDELDALAYSRAKASSEHSRRIVNEFLTQLDGVLSQNRDVLVLAASNMPWDVDSAMKRSGRFARQVFVPPPDLVARVHMFNLKLDGVPTEALDVDALAKATPFYSGADIEGLIDLAKERVIAHAIDTGVERPLRQQDLLQAVQEYAASTLEWLRTARNLVRYGGDGGYRELEQYLKLHKLI
mgnify:FL=1